MKSALLVVPFRPMALLYGAASSRRPHARQPFVISKDTALIFHETSYSFKKCSHPFINASGCINPELGQLGDNGAAYRRWQERMLPYRRGNKQEGPEPALARAAATGQAGNTARVSHTTPVTIHKTRVPDTRSRGLTVATVTTLIAQP